MTDQELAWSVRAEILAHDFTEREKDLLEVILLCSLDVGREDAMVAGGFGSFTGRRDDEERRILAALARSGVIEWDGKAARLLPDPAGWKIRRKVLTTALVAAPRQTEFIEDRPLDAALASASRDTAEAALARRLAERSRLLPPAPGGAANSHDPPCEPAKTQPSLAKLSSALGSAQAKPKAKLSCEAVEVELKRAIGDAAFGRFWQWRHLVETDPEYVAGQLRYAAAVERERGIEIRSMGGYLSRIARDDGRWPERKGAP